MQILELIAAAALLWSANASNRQLEQMRVKRDEALQTNDWRATILYQAEVDAAERDANFRLLLGALIAMSVYVRMQM